MLPPYMDEYTGKRAAGGLLASRKSSSLVVRDIANNNTDGNAQFCNRIGCSGRLNYTRCTQIGSSEKTKSWRPSFRSSSGKEITGSSSRTCSIATNAKKTFQEPRKKLSSNSSESSSSGQDELEFQELIVSSRTVPRGFQSELREAESNGKKRSSFCQKSGLTNQDALGSSSSKCTGQGVRPFSNSSRYGLRNLRCNSKSDAIAPGLSESNISKNIVRKRSPEGESSSSVRGKKTNGPPPNNITKSSNGLAFPDSRGHRNWPPNRDSGVTSVRTRRSTNGNIRTGHSNQVNGNNLSMTSSVASPQVRQSEISYSANNPSSLHQEAFSSGSSSYSRSSNDDMPAELYRAILMNRDGSRQYDMDGIAEVLLSLERIEQDEELTYVQLLALESNLFTGGLSFYDQHRDMRLDIDNMSYEELLALEEKMGDVSTALSEEALLKSIRRITYQPVLADEGVYSIEEDDIKCSICQEEYATGDVVGIVGCEHGYHMGCIEQWLRLKNWCPICKASVLPSETSELS